MAEYKLTGGSVDCVVRVGVTNPTGEVYDVWIPNDPGNRDWVEYQEWLTAGGVPDPYVPPPEAKKTLKP